MSISLEQKWDVGARGGGEGGMAMRGVREGVVREGGGAQSRF